MRFLCAALFATTLLIGCGAAHASAIARPNALDRRVDLLPRGALLSEPAILLVDRDRQVAALRRVHWTLPGWVLIQLVEAAALFYLWSSGGAAALRDRLRRRMSDDWRLRFVFGAALGLIARCAAFLPAFYLYRVDRTMELSVELTRMWALFWLIDTILGMIVAGLIAAIVLGLVARTQQWYVYTILAILAGCIAWSYASPYAAFPGSTTIQPRGRLATDIHAMLLRADFTRVPVQVERTPAAGATEPEIEYRVAVELAHVAHHDPLFIALIEGGVIIVFSALAVVIADRIGFRRDDDPLSRLAIVGALLALVYLAAVPVRNAALRSYDFSADRYAVALTGDPAAAVRALVRRSDQRMEEVCPELTAVLFLYTSPGTGARVAAINHVPSGCR